MSGAAGRVATVLGLLAAAAGGASVALAVLGGGGFAEAAQGPRLLNLHHANGLGGLVLVLGGALGLVAGTARRRPLAVAAGLLLLAGAVGTAAGQAAGANVLGATASTAAVYLGLGGGLLACGLTPDHER